MKYRLFIGSYKNYKINRKYRRSGCLHVLSLCMHQVVSDMPCNKIFRESSILTRWSVYIFWAMGFFKGQTFKLKGNFQRGKGGAFLKSLFGVAGIHVGSIFRVHKVRYLRCLLHFWTMRVGTFLRLGGY